MRHFRIAAAAMLLISTCGGCFTYMQDDGEVQISLATTLTLKQIGPKDAERRSEAGIDLPPWMQNPFVKFFIDLIGDDDADITGDEDDTPAE